VFRHTAELVGKALLKAGFEPEYIVDEIKVFADIYFTMHQEVHPPPEQIH
jgi:hypothetical protein